ncbi:MAG TPA: VCBS repeat-containing protein [Chloroflexota bacterium]|nr:VCBS repeat-containing protein [Chloroflexota bacterium]
MILMLFAWTVNRAEEQTVVAQNYPSHPGFPRFEAGGTITFGSPTIMDINKDGQLDILVPDGHGCVWAWDHTGAVLPNFPLKTGSSCQGTPRINGPLAVGDMDGDGLLEIAAGTRGTSSSPGQRGKVFVWHANGSLAVGWPKEMAWNEQFGSGLPEVLTVAMANMTGDDRLELIAGTSNNASAGGTPQDPTHNLYAFFGNGVLLPGFPTEYRRAGIWGFVGAADLNGDGYAEILTGRDHAFVHAYNAQGNPLPAWPVESPVNPNDPQGLFLEFTRDAPSMGDLDGDGDIEIIIAGKVRDPNQNRDVTNSGLLVLKANGQREPGWQVAKLGGAPIFNDFLPTQAPALADLDDDGELEIVVGMLDGTIRMYQANGSLVWQYDFAQGRRLFASEPVIGDVTGDGRPDILFGTYSPDGSANAQARLHGLNASGQPLPGFPLSLGHEGQSDKQGLRAAPTLADLDGDCLVEIIAGSQAGVLYVWDSPAAYYPSLLPWPTARHDFQRTGFTGTAVTPALVPTHSTTLNLDYHTYLPLIEHQVCR